MRTILAILLATLLAGCWSPPTTVEPDVVVWGKWASVGESPQHEWYFHEDGLVMGYYVHGDVQEFWVGEYTARGRGLFWHEFEGIKGDGVIHGSFAGYHLRLERVLWGTVVP